MIDFPEYEYTTPDGRKIPIEVDPELPEHLICFVNDKTGLIRILNIKDGRVHEFPLSAE